MTTSLSKLFDDVVWEPLEVTLNSANDTDVYPTHEGILKVEDFEIHCWQCSNGEIAFDAEDIERFFRGCHLCDHPSHCPDCNPTTEERSRSRAGLLVGEEFEQP
jgi:hypothetical protein